MGARRFAKQVGARLTEVKGADHRMMGGREQVIDAVVMMQREFSNYAKGRQLVFKTDWRPFA